jgi:hypothetical protein
MAIQSGESDMRDFMSGGGWTFPVALVQDQLALSYGVRYLPTIIVVDAEGQIVKRLIGGQGAAASDLSRLVDDLTE